MVLHKLANHRVVVVTHSLVLLLLVSTYKAVGLIGREAIIGKREDGIGLATREVSVVVAALQHTSEVAQLAL